MMTRLVWQIACLCIAGDGFMLNGQAVPKVTLTPFGSGMVSIRQWNPNSLPSSTPLVGTNSAASPQIFVHLSNQSNKPIVITILVYISKDSTNRLQRRISTCNSALTAANTPIAPPNSTVLLGPHQCIPQVSSADASTGRIGVSTSLDADQFLMPLRNATEITVVLDAVVFADGEVVGPDAYHQATDNVARAAASVRLAKQVRAAMASGKTILTAVASVVDSIPVRPGQNLEADPNSQAVREQMWIRRLAQRLLTSIHPEAELLSFEAQPGPLSIHRSVSQ